VPRWELKGDGAMIEHRIGTTHRSDVVHAISKVVVRPALRYAPMTRHVPHLLRVVDRVADVIPRSGRCTHQEIVADTWRGELVTPIDGTTADGVILYAHGGAFLACGMATHRRIVDRLCQRTGMAVLNVDYRQLPIGTVQDAIDDCLDAVGWLERQGFPASQVVLSGDSAGGHLAFATALALREQGATPAGIVGLSPWLDFDHTSKVSHHNARRDAYIPVRKLRRVGRMALGCQVEDYLSPVDADLDGLPPSLIICGEDEVLRVDAEMMAERLLDAEVQCTLQVWERQVHAFPVLTDLNPESLAAVEEVAVFARDVVARAAVRTSARPAAALRSIGGVA
jgi:acetyl esterase/lipase